MIQRKEFSSRICRGDNDWEGLFGDTKSVGKSRVVKFQTEERAPPPGTRNFFVKLHRNTEIIIAGGL